jgi:predicted nucleotidyltransferase component of viral defense system
MEVPLKLDITTGDVITPKEITYDYKLLLEDRVISVLAYNPETVLAEKLETVISRSDQNTRPRDYYDIYILAQMKAEELDLEKLAAALDATAQRRGSTKILERYRDIMQTVKSSEVMQKQWENYRKDFAYAADIAFEDTCDAVERLMSRLK